MNSCHSRTVRKNLTGARGVSAVHSLMIKRALPAVLSLFSLCLPLAAQQMNHPDQTDDQTITLDQFRLTSATDTTSAVSLYQTDIFTTANGSGPTYGLPALTFLDGRRILGTSALGWMGMAPLDLFPIALLSPVEVKKIDPSPTHSAGSPEEVVKLRVNQDYYAGGEVGFAYGKSTGKFGGEAKQAYILSGVGNDKLQITVGATYEESSVRFPRLSR